MLVFTDYRHYSFPPLLLNTLCIYSLEVLVAISPAQAYTTQQQQNPFVLLTYQDTQVVGTTSSF
jgi:hypothetical protein